MNVTRSIVNGVVGSCKTESSQKPVPLHPILGNALSTWREHTQYRDSADWVFASRLRSGRKPCWGQVIMRKYVQPAARRVNINKRIGWHTFRHTYSTLLRSVGAEFKVMQELLRHSSPKTTLEIYTQAVTPAKHAAQAAVLALLFPGTENRLRKSESVPACLPSWQSGGSTIRGAQKRHQDVPFCTREDKAKIPLSFCF
jgi:integrase